MIITTDTRSCFFVQYWKAADACEEGNAVSSYVYT